MGMYDEGRELRFPVSELSSDIARGKAAVPLSVIAALCPDIFNRKLAPEEDVEIRLPLQKLVEQIGLLPARKPAAKLSEDGTPNFFQRVQKPPEPLPLQTGEVSHAEVNAKPAPIPESAPVREPEGKKARVERAISLQTLSVDQPDELPAKSEDSPVAEPMTVASPEVLDAGNSPDELIATEAPAEDPAAATPDLSTAEVSGVPVSTHGNGEVLRADGPEIVAFPFRNSAEVPLADLSSAVEGVPEGTEGEKLPRKNPFEEYLSQTAKPPLPSEKFEIDSREDLAGIDPLNVPVEPASDRGSGAAAGAAGAAGAAPAG